MGAFPPGDPQLMSLGTTGGLHPRGALSTALGAPTHCLSLLLQHAGPRAAEAAHPGPQPTLHGGGLSRVPGAVVKPEKSPGNPGDSPLTALAVPPTLGSSSCPKHLGKGTNPGVTPKGSDAECGGIRPGGPAWPAGRSLTCARHGASQHRFPLPPDLCCPGRKRGCKTFCWREGEVAARRDPSPSPPGCLPQGWGEPTAPHHSPAPECPRTPSSGQHWGVLGGALPPLK